MDSSVTFMKADARNLPKMTYIMILEFMADSDKHNVAEIRGVKALMSSRDSYVDTAVGYVEVGRKINECLVKCKIVPEHKITSNKYSVTVTIDEKNNVIMDTICDGCPASAGGCKHTLVFLFWLNKRSEEPASTSVECYWRKPKLISARVDILLSKNTFTNKKTIKLKPKDPGVYLRFTNECHKHNIKMSLIQNYAPQQPPKITFNLFDMTIKFTQNETDFSFENYKSILDRQITKRIIKVNCEKTKEQINSRLWHSLRQGRITVSKIYEASRCHTDGSLVQQILGGYKVPETVAIRRGKMLERKVITQVEKYLGKKIEKSGFILINSLVGASPDGINNDFVLEVKCPMSQNSIKNYIDNKKIGNKVMAQMQIQMLAANKKRALLCLADPLFEENKKIKLIWIDYNKDLINDLMTKATEFWKTYIYKKMLKSAMS